MGGRVISMALKLNEEAVNDRAKLIMHRLAARRLASNPSLIDVAKSRITGGSQPPEYVSEWRDVLDLDAAEVRRTITSRSEKMERLRLSSPFGLVLDFTEPVLRRRIWRLARKGFAKGNEDLPHRSGGASLG